MLPAWGAWRQACLPPQSSFRPTPIAWPALHWLPPAPPDEGKGLCVDQSSDNRVVIAEILLRNSEAPAALEKIQPALDEFDRTGRIESSWRPGPRPPPPRRANHDPAGPRKPSETASARLADLEKSWPAADLAAYL